MGRSRGPTRARAHGLEGARVFPHVPACVRASFVLFSVVVLLTLFPLSCPRFRPYFRDCFTWRCLPRCRPTCVGSFWARFMATWHPPIQGSGDDLAARGCSMLLASLAARVARPWVVRSSIGTIVSVGHVCWQRGVQFAILDVVTSASAGARHVLAGFQKGMRNSRNAAGLCPVRSSDAQVTRLGDLVARWLLGRVAIIAAVTDRGSSCVATPVFLKTVERYDF